MLKNVIEWITLNPRWTRFQLFLGKQCLLLAITAAVILLPRWSHRQPSEKRGTGWVIRQVLLVRSPGWELVLLQRTIQIQALSLPWQNRFCGCWGQWGVHIWIGVDLIDVLIKQNNSVLFLPSTMQTSGLLVAGWWSAYSSPIRWPKRFSWRKRKSLKLVFIPRGVINQYQQFV